MDDNKSADSAAKKNGNFGERKVVGSQMHWKSETGESARNNRPPMAEMWHTATESEIIKLEIGCCVWKPTVHEGRYAFWTSH